ncbi:MAG: hypothetical protein M5R36_02615 [Deltaproteobacteria bacterium]|nr:hypothetical protein [Deltaproteobacteria bacterium]
MRKIPERVDAAMRRAALVFAVVAGLLFAFVAFSRAGYPYELEFEEGDLFLTALRVLDGQPIYPDPAQDPNFVPLLYTPFYYHAAALFVAVLGRSIFACRVLSILATFAIAALIVRAGRRAGSGLAHAATAGLLFHRVFSGIRLLVRPRASRRFVSRPRSRRLHAARPRRPSARASHGRGTVARSCGL